MKYFIALLFIASTTLADSQTKSPTSTSGSGANWSNSDNVLVSDATMSINTGTNQHWVHTTTYGFSIPSDATIDSVVAHSEGCAESTASDGTRAQLIKAGSLSGSGFNLNMSVNAFCAFDDGDATISFTGHGLWGLTLTPSDVNATNFGYGLRKANTSSDFLRVDYNSLTVYYTPAPDLSTVFFITGG